MAEQAQELRAELGDDPAGDCIAQAAICAAAILASATQDSHAALNWLYPQLQAWERAALDRARVLSTKYSVRIEVSKRMVGTAHSTTHLYDMFLHHYARASRKRSGVFFTPEPIADYIVAQIDRLLREECGFANGIADERATIIDPACGSGVFLIAVIKFLRNKLNDSCCLEGMLARLIGIEILPPAALLAKLNVALMLAEMGYDFRDAGKINILTADALSPDIQSKIQNPKSKIFPVLLGNPPFSSLSANGNEWIARLVRGDEEIRGYVRANGQQLGERKTWLHDDYVKFIRLAQWHVEEAGCGIIGFVTNHGYLDNATFRLMRHELLRVFPHIEILDLHGNRKKHEIAPDGNRDENVFGLDQGVAISLLCRPSTLAKGSGEDRSYSSVKYSELWGSRDEKVNALVAATGTSKQSRLPSLALRAHVLTPRQPDWQFVPVTASATCAEYAAAWSLAEAMPVNTTAPVTARDHFVVAFTRAELIARIEEFRNLTIPDEEIRERYFNRTRSARYQSGDTRGWKLADARRIVAADDQWQEHIIRCLYRPFDWRYVFWHPGMIDWPRTEVTRHLLEPNFELRIQNSESGHTPDDHSAFCTLNSVLCLIARRQQLPTQPCTFFWISDCLALDGAIRSDNRGSESLFPLYIDQRANFALPFIEQFAAAAKLTWRPLGRGDLSSTFGPEDLLAYIYAIFHSPSYRQKNASELRRDFPRILLPSTTEQFARMARLGHELIDLHLLRVPHSVLSTQYSVHSTDQQAADASDVVAFRAGGYLALKKWLQPKHRSDDDRDYQRITTAIGRTIEIMGQIDR
jgi:predicted helicase